MKQVIIYRDEETGLGMIGSHPLSIEMVDCLIRQYRLMGWKERKTTSTNLYHFTINE